jgi:phage terminase Nu1 subunit (DNA packaging protein)
MPDWITGWKKIAQYLDVGERTARKYERQGLPVYRKFGTVRAKPVELDAFIKNSAARGKAA